MLGNIKNGLDYIRKCFYNTPTVPNYSEVININSPEDSEEIVIKTKTEFSNIFSEYEENKTHSIKEHTLDLSQNEDRDKIKKLISKTNISEPSELIGERIPTKPTKDYRYTDRLPYHRPKNRYYDFDYIIDVTHSKMTILEVINRYIYRILMKLNCIERYRKENNMNQGRYRLNRNIFLYVSFIIGMFALLTSSIFLTVLSGILTSAYITIVLRSLALGLYDFVSNNPENRYKIKSKLNN